METEKFVGPKKVLMVVEDELKTYGNNDVVIVHYDGGSTEMMPKKTYELIATDSPSDYNTIRDLKFKALYKELYPIVAECVAVSAEDEDIKKTKRAESLQKALAVIAEIDLKDSEIQTFFTQMNVEFVSIPNSIMFELSNQFSRAINWLWTKDDSQFIPGADVMYNRTYLETKKIIESIPKKDEGISTT